MGTFYNTTPILDHWMVRPIIGFTVWRTKAVFQLHVAAMNLCSCFPAGLRRVWSRALLSCSGTPGGSRQPARPAWACLSSTPATHTSRPVSFCPSFNFYCFSGEKEDVESVICSAHVQYANVKGSPIGLHNIKICITYILDNLMVI